MPQSWSERLRWPVFVLPFVVYMLAGTVEPQPPVKDEVTGVEVQKSPWLDLGQRYEHYPIVYTARLGLTVLAMLAVWPGYRQFPCRVDGLALLTGVVGGILWIGLCELNWEEKYIFSQAPPGHDWLRDLGKRAAFNPFEALQHNLAWAYGFLLIRFIGLVLIVPIIEEWFLRGFVYRYVVSPEWWEVTFDRWHKPALVLVTLYGIVSHPAECIAAAAWFSLISWLMLRTKSLWACVTAHAVTNLILGVYVVIHGGTAWRLL